MEISEKAADMIQALIHDTCALLISGYADDRKPVFRKDVAELKDYIAALETENKRLNGSIGHIEEVSE